ncbi:MAG: tRNA (guanosine(37)-N1)-methyltransferase TrmD [Chlamydiales bacterium]|nr:tRNA (guanosine(37)-N1)-methyltransferase TrmD [Chlamydiales bacterium]
MHIDILSLFPDYFRGPFDESMLARARKQGLIDLNLVDLRQYGVGNYKQVDDRAYGGGPGMVLMPEPVTKALRDTKQRLPNAQQRTVFLSPQGPPLSAQKCRELSTVEHLILLCGHYEGVDQRVLDTEVDEEISIGDYVLTNGCLPAIVLVDAVARFIPGVIGHSDAAAEDSFEHQLLDCPHYTRPEVFEGLEVPKVLLEGNHAAIDKWRHERAVAKTRLVRPDLWVKYLDKDEAPQSPSKATLQQVTLMVSDLRRSRRYYRQVLGAKAVSEDNEKLVYSVGDVRIALVEGLQGSVERQPITLEATVKTAGEEQTVWFIDPDGYQWVLRKTKS